MTVSTSNAWAGDTTGEEFADAMRSKPDLRRGAKLFRTCAGCHGQYGEGARDGGVPRIAGQHAPVLISQLVDNRHDRRWNPYMEHLADWPELPDAQALADVAGFVSQLRDALPNGQGNGELVPHGAVQYAHLCLRCHGAHGEGDAPHAIPKLAGQHYAYLERQLEDALDGRRPNFSAVHIRLLTRLDREDIVGVADYLSRLPVEENGSTPPAR